MSESNRCQLCLNNCNNYMRLSDENGHRNEAYKIALNFFSTTLFSLEPGFLCMECWCHIFLFHKFRESVLRVHAELVANEKLIHVAESRLELSSEVATSRNGPNIDDGLNTVTIVKDEVDSIFMPDLELMDVYQDTKFRSNEDEMLLTSSCRMKPREYQDNGPKRKLERNEVEADVVSDDGESVSSNDDTDQMAEEFDDPVGLFIGGSFNEEHMSTEHLGKSDNISTTKDAGFSISDKIMLHTVNYNTDYNQAVFHGSHYYNTGCNQQQQKVAPNNPNEVRSCRESDYIISKWLPNLECAVCNEPFSSFTLLKEHSRQNHPKAEFYVSCCQRKFNYRCQIEKHIRLHLDPKSFKCKLCGKRFSTKCYLQSHRCLQQISYVDQSSEDASTNTNRIQIFQDMDDLIAKWKPYLQCVVCNRSFSRYSVLHVHFRQIHPNEKFYVVCCRRKFSRRYKLVDHIRVHLDPTSFQCDICGRNLANRDILQVHKLSQHATSKGDSPNKDNNQKIKTNKMVGNQTK